MGSCSLPNGCLEDNSVTTTDVGITCPNVMMSSSDDEDAQIEAFMVAKEESKMEDKKWLLYAEYIADDLSLWELRDLADVSGNVLMDKVSVGVAVSNGWKKKNLHFIIVG